MRSGGWAHRICDIDAILQTLLFEIKPTDPITFGVLTALLASVALLACLIPAQRASRVDPLMALRHE